jgi:hypothetical protein
MATRTAAFEAMAELDEPALRRLDRLARLLDEAFRIPGTRFRIGIDGLIGMAPGVGDLVTAAIALYPVIEAARLGVPNRVLARMLVNVGIDTGLGAVPVVGDIFDIAFKSNRRNIDLLRKHLREQGRPGSVS